MKAPKKILLLRFSSLGDIVMTTAAVRCLRNAFPDARIDMVVREDFRDLIRLNPHLTGAYGLPRSSGVRGLRELLRQLNANRYDLVYDAHRSLRTRFLMPLIRSPHKAYFDKHYLRRALALTFKVRILDRRRFLERFIDPLKPFGVRDDGKGPEVFVDESTTLSAFARAGLRPGAGTLVGIIPSAQWPGKRWPAERFGAVVRELVAQTSHRLIVFGGKQDTFCQDIVRGMPADRVVNTQGKLTILESAALLKHCAFVVANDTGLMHVADALNVPSVLIFGPTSAELGCLPHHPKTHLVEIDMWCRPCSKNGQAPCIRGKRLCLDNISPTAVVDQALQIDRELVSEGNG